MEFHDSHTSRLIFKQKIKEIQKHLKMIHSHIYNFADIGNDGLAEVLEITILNKNLLKTEEHRLVLTLQDFGMQNSNNAEDIHLIFTV